MVQSPIDYLMNLLQGLTSMVVDWNLLIRYLAGACEDEERVQFEQWLAEAPEHRAVCEGARATVAQAWRDVSASRRAELLTSLRSDIATSEIKDSRLPTLRVVRDEPRREVAFSLLTRQFRWSRPLKIAAATLFVVGSAGLWGVFRNGAPAWKAVASAPLREVMTARGERMTFLLPDGSTVMLAPESRLRVPNDYGTHHRTVSLIGEGAFTVTHDATRPFAVQTAHGFAKDLGTRFVVREYEGDTSVEVIVAEGEVELRGQNGHTSRVVSLTQGQLGRADTSGELTVRTDIDLGHYFAWTEGRLVLRDIPLRDAVVQLARWYDVEVKLASDAIAERHLTALAKDEPVDDVLRSIATSLELELEISTSGRMYTFRTR